MVQAEHSARQRKWMINPRLMLLFLVVSLLFASCKTNRIYIVRHAEKAAVLNGADNSDPVLSEAGRYRAIALRERLSGARIAAVWSTRYLRTRLTAEPVAEYFRLKTQIMAAVPDSSFIGFIRHAKSDILIVGHSNTVDDLVNRISGKPAVDGDLGESVYDRLYLIRHRGNKFRVRVELFGDAENLR